MDLFILNLRMQFMPGNHSLKKNYKQFLVKNEIGANTILKFFGIFFNFFNVFLIKLLNII